jgi:hypothetical protein
MEKGEAVSTQPDALGYAVCLDARGFAAEAAELRRLHTVNAELLEALQLALSAHGRMLMSDPPQDAWKAYGVEEKARAAIIKATEVKP